MIRLSPWGVADGELAATTRLRSDAGLLQRLTAPAHGAWFWTALWIATLAAGCVALTPAVTGEPAPIPGSEVVFRLAGVSFAVCGLIAWRRRPDSNVGRLMTFAGVSLFVYPIASQLGSDLLTSLATLFASVWTVAFVALILSFQSGGRLQTSFDRLLVGVAFLALFVLQFTRMLFAPFPGNALLVSPSLSAYTTIGDVQFILSIAVSIGIVGVIATRWAQASSPGRRALLPSVAGCLCSLTFAFMLLTYLLTRQIPEWLSWVTNAALLTVPAAFLAGMLHSRLARGGLAELFRELGGLRGERLQSGLAKSLGDPGLALAYRRPDGYVDVQGNALTLPAERNGRAIVRVERDGRDLGALLYDPMLDDDPELVQAVSAAAAIALDDERIHAESAATLAELRASRERIVAAGDAERRRLERNLHDGAQQRLVALRMQLGMLQGSVREDPALAEQLAAVGDEVLQSLQELRELAQGIHPAVLDHGLEAALESLATRSTVPTSVAAAGADDLPAQVNLAAYFVACEALANVAKYAHASHASVRVSRRNGVAVIEIADDGVGGADEMAGSGLRGLADRVAALDGTLRISSPQGAGTVVTAEMPCA